MKLHISDEQRAELANIFHDWHRAKNVQSSCVDTVMDVLQIDPDESINMLNNYVNSDRVLDDHGIEVHRASVARIPWQIDGETALVWLLIVGGSFIVGCAVG